MFIKLVSPIKTQSTMLAIVLKVTTKVQIFNMVFSMCLLAFQGSAYGTLVLYFSWLSSNFFNVIEQNWSVLSCKKDRHQCHDNTFHFIIYFQLFNCFYILIGVDKTYSFYQNSYHNDHNHTGNNLGNGCFLNGFQHGAVEKIRIHKLCIFAWARLSQLIFAQRNFEALFYLVQEEGLQAGFYLQERPSKLNNSTAQHSHNPNTLKILPLFPSSPACW